MQQSEPYVITKKRTVRRIYWHRIVIAVFLVCAAVAGGVLWFSCAPGRISVRKREYRLLSVGEYADLAEASVRVEQAVTAGGAGYVYGDGPYTVAIACYANEADAEAVRARIEANGETAKILVLASPAITLETPSDKSEAELLRKMLPRPGELFDELYAVSVKADTKEITEAAAQYAVLKMSVACGDYAKSCADAKSDAGAYLAALFLSLGDTFDTAARAEKNVLQAVKYALCESAVRICRQTEAFTR